MPKQELVEDTTDVTSAKESSTGKKYKWITLGLLCLLPGGLAGIVIYKGYSVARKVGKSYAESVTKKRQKKKTK